MEKLLINWQIKEWYLLDLIPDGNAKKFYPNVVVRLKQLYNELNKLISLADKMNEIGFFDFPFCLFKPELRNNPHFVFINAKMRGLSSHQVGYDPKRITHDKKGKYKDAYRINVDLCQKCIYYQECGGIWQKYLALYGDNELKILAYKNSCII